MPSLSFFRCAWLALSAFVFAGAAQAQAVADPAAELGALTQRWLDDALTRNQAPGATLRMEVSVGTLDSRLRLAPCSRVEPYLPAGSRLWGRTRLGLRCVEGSSAWNVFLPVTIKAWGPAWVLTGNVAPGAVLTSNDAARLGNHHGDLPVGDHGHPGQVVTLHGQLLANGGQPLFKLRGKLGGGNAFGLLQHPGKSSGCVAQRSAGGLQRRGIQGQQGP